MPYHTILLSNRKVQKVQKVTELRKEIIDIDKKQFSNEERELYRYIHYPPISSSRISVTLTDEYLVKFYYFVSQYDTLFLTKVFLSSVAVKK